jgi:formate-dependent nitrite reductase membrane component NrfD
MVLSLFALANTAILLAGALARRKREPGAKKRGGLLMILAVACGIATPIIWLAHDWPITGLSFANSWTPYVAAAFVANAALTFAYNIVKGKPVESVDA